MRPVRTDTRPWYRQFWPWFIIAIPASSVVVGLAMLWIASGSRNEVLDTKYYDRGLEVNQLLSRQEYARNAGIGATLSVPAQGGTLKLFLDGNLPPTDSLILALSSVSGRQADRIIELDAENARLFSAELTTAISGNFYLILEPKDQRWRLKGSALLPSSVPIQLNADNRR